MAAAFDEAAGGWLSAAERDNNLILSVVKNAARRDDPSRGWLVTDSAAPRLALFQTPPHYLLLSAGCAEAAAWIAGSLERPLPGVVGPAALSDAFAAQWSKRTGQTPRLNSEMTFYTLDRVEAYSRPRGELRQATPAEFERLAPLAAAAARDMRLPAPEQEPSEVEKSLRQLLGEGKQFVWEDGNAIRAIVSYTESLPHAGARIRGVYTPTEFRGQGFGTAITGTLAEWLLARGQKWVSLFADNANPTSTGIYRRLGFQPRLVYRSLRFE